MSGEEMTPHEMKALAKEAAMEAVQETLIRIGADHTTPVELQKDFAALRAIRKLIDEDRFYENLEAVEEWRRTQRVVQRAGVWAIVTTVTGGVLAMLWLGVKHEILSWFS